MNARPCLAFLAVRDSLAGKEPHMTTMNISLTEEIKTFIKGRIAEEGFASASEYLRSLVREAQKRKARQALEAKLLEGLQGAVGETRTEIELPKELMYS
jgi:antitoxin ParD1/3/4